ncbi:MAG: glycosyl transferase [Pedobacter sp.]|nr:MAG: glycosyl transferase [Pedobacter sp.]
MIQRVIDLIYRYPKSYLKRINSFGGLLAYRKMLHGEKEMIVSAFRLKPITSFDNGLPVYFLTGKKYIHQTIFCIHSLKKVSKEKFSFTLVDDGSFDKDIIEKINAIIINCKIITTEQIEENVEEILPKTTFPTIHKKRAEYAHIKKLTDIHTLPHTRDFKLVLDSDMLFWKEPKEIIEWLKEPNKPIHMIDCVEAYGYTIELMQKLTKSTIKEKINVGALGLNSSNINWIALEEWISQMELEEGTSYFLEQALSAMLIGNRNSITLSETDYIVNPNKQDTNGLAGVLHHYVDLSKAFYYQTAWKKL